jgi:hypothetical protein
MDGGISEWANCKERSLALRQKNSFAPSEAVKIPRSDPKKIPYSSHQSSCNIRG